MSDENRDPLWGVDTSKWTRAQHRKAWALFIPYALGVGLLGWGLAKLLSWLPS